MNALLHHLDDGGVHLLLLKAYNVLAAGGIAFTLDGCFVDRQNPVEYLLKNRPGRIRPDRIALTAPCASEFGKIDLYVRNDVFPCSVHYVFTHLQKVR